MGNLKNRNLLFTVLEAGSPRSGCQHGQGLVKTHLLVSSHAEEPETSTLVSSYKSTKPTGKGSALLIYSLPKAPSPNTED